MPINDHKPSIFDTFVGEITKNLNEVLDGIRKDFNGPTEDGYPEAPAKEDPTVPETVEGDGFESFDPEEFELFFTGDAISPAWEAVEAETAADDGDHEKANSYIAIADRYIRLADIFAETEVTFSN